ncbi:LLM class flavin-dependent oxidoreductase [Salipiger abyssi]|uniref:LLM class flavin-dependent oxidoreductase n=1 Tax=Salipiger abyssi TaxID=1250539 RepID=UPI0040599FB3
MRTDRKIHLGLYATATGANVAGWRHPGAVADLGANIEQAAELAREAERGLFDLLFLADSMAMRGHNWEILSRGSTRYVAQFEPVTLLSALAMVTRHVGLVATHNTTYEEPYMLARKFASLDLLSGGRAGWNLVTSSNMDEAPNFSHDRHPPHAERYERAEEFVDVVAGLWTGWAPDALPRDKESGIFFDPAKVSVLNHEGRHFQVRGPLNVPPSPQGHTVIVQAGASEPGKAMAARTAEVIFGLHPDMAAARAFYEDVKGRMPDYGRDPGELVIMPGISVFVDEDAGRAAEKRQEMLDLIDPVVGRDFLRHMLGDVIDLDALGDDEMLPDLAESNANRSAQERILKSAREEGLTIRDLYQRQASKGAPCFVGTPEQVVDEMQAWFEGGAADGFIFLMDYFPGSLTDFNRLVVPELQRRGLYRAEYEATTLRGNLGLARGC